MSFNMTKREANQRAEFNRANIRWDSSLGEYRVTLWEWHNLPRKECEAKAYYTDDLEDAVLTAGAMRKQANDNA